MSKYKSRIEVCIGGNMKRSSRSSLNGTTKYRDVKRITITSTIEKRIQDLRPEEEEKLKKVHGFLSKNTKKMPLKIEESWREKKKNTDLFRNFYIAILQGITLEGMQRMEKNRIIYSDELKEAINRFLHIFQYRLRRKMMEHLNYTILHNILSERFKEMNLSKKTWELLSEGMMYREHEEISQFLTDHWDDLVMVIYPFVKEQVTLFMGEDIEVAKSWFKMEENLSKYFDSSIPLEQKPNPVLILNELKTIEHHHGTILQEWFWTDEELEDFYFKKEAEYGRKELEKIIEEYRKKENVESTFEATRRLIWDDFSNKLDDPVKNFNL